ncbi:NAD-dependent protein deacylase [Ruminococcaceae bacterium OttesenSCG-928-I18]|nr:NAD-dependent protein deacylase [Ruminococcaceae bacterium OttesenSCG-928-I18]
MDQNQLAKLGEILRGSSNIVFFGGAGVSTESGIPDFRSEDGLYRQKYPYPPETMLSHHFYRTHKEEFFDFYREKVLALWAEPNAAHHKLAQLEKTGKLRAVITQNIDGLHQKAGSEEVIELHGSVLRNYCEVCKKAYDAEHIQKAKGIPKCTCGGDVKPDVVLYEESLREEDLQRAARYVSAAETLLIGGTSLAVYPAAGLVDLFSGKHLILINKGETSRSPGASLTINAPIGQVMESLEV